MYFLLLGWYSMYRFLQGNVLLRHLLYEESLSVSYPKSAVEEINKWALFSMIDIYQSSFINFKCSEIANCENQMGEGKKKVL